MSRRQIFIIFSFLLFHGLAFFYILNLEQRLPENIFLGSTNVSGFSQNELRQTVDQLVINRKKKIYHFLLNAEIRAQKTLTELGLSYDKDRTVEQVFASLPAWYRFFPLSSLAGNEKTIFQPVLQVNAFQFAKAIEEIVLPEKKSPQNATISRRGTTFVLQEDIPGVDIPDEGLKRLAESVMKAANEDQSEIFLSPEMTLMDAKIKRDGLVPMFTTLQNLLHQPIEFRFGKEKKILDLREHEDGLILNVAERTFFFNPSFLNRYLQKELSVWEKAPGGVSVNGIREEPSPYDGKIVKRAVIEGDFRHGIVIDQEVLRTQLDQLLKDPKHSRIIEVPLKESLAKIVSLVDGYEFSERLSLGITSFRLGNYAARVKNIKLSLAALQNAVLEPGEEVSFNRLTGFVTKEKGYTVTKIIVDGEVKEGLGGGVCQTSTTLFRTILNAGLPILERRNHSLDVAYYHQYGYGLDATVYTESRQDLRFKNDYAFPILINTFTDDEKAEAFIEFYGLKKERTVELMEQKTGHALHKKWNWSVSIGDKKEERIVESWYIPPKEKKEPVNPLEG